MMYPDIMNLLKYERYIRVMTYSELDQLKSGRDDWRPEDFERWEMLLVCRDYERERRISESMKRSRQTLESAK